jgi:hypothetical protein
LAGKRDGEGVASRFSLAASGLKTIEQEFAMKTFNRLYAKISKWAEGGHRRLPTRRLRLEIEALERRDLMSASANPLAWTGWTQDTQAAGVTAISTVRDTNGNVDVFAIAPDQSRGGIGSLWYRSQALNGTWKPLGYGAGSSGVTSISTLLDYNGNVDIFAVDTDQTVSYRSLSPSGTTGSWTLLVGGAHVRSISTVNDARGYVNVFANCTDNSVWYDPVLAGNSGLGWQPAYGGVTSISTVRDANGNVDVFGIAPDQSVWYRSRDADGLWTSSTWTNLYMPWGGWSFVPVTSINTAVDANGNVDVFAAGYDQSVYYASQSPSGSWGSWTYLGNGVTSISTARVGNGDLYAFAITTDNKVYFNVDPGSGNWSGWTRLDGGVTAISAVCDNAGNAAVFAIAPGGSEWYDERAKYSPAPANATLFGTDSSGRSLPPSYLDVHQGGLGTCWLLASLAAVAAQEPLVIQNMFQLIGVAKQADGSFVHTYNVYFYDSTPSHTRHYVTVDDKLPSTGWRDQLVGGAANPVNGSSTPVLWVALAEKAYVVAAAAGYVTASHPFNDYAVVNWGSAENALVAITGHQPGSYNSIDPNAVANAWQLGQPVVLHAGGHDYALVNYDASSGQPYKVFNPYGSVAYYDGSSLSQNFDAWSCVQGGAAPGGWEGYHAGGSPELVDRAFLHDRLEAQLMTQPQYLSSRSCGVGTAPGRSDGCHAARSQELVDVAFLDDLFDPHGMPQSGSAVVDLLDFAR